MTNRRSQSFRSDEIHTLHELMLAVLAGRHPSTLVERDAFRRAFRRVDYMKRALEVDAEEERLLAQRKRSAETTGTRTG